MDKEHSWAAAREERLMQSLMLENVLITFQEKPVRPGPHRQITNSLTFVVLRASRKIKRSVQDTA